MSRTIRIGTRESQLALWQANRVKDLLVAAGFATELVHIKSEGDTNLTTPLYEMGVQGIFTRSLDIALLENRIDIAVHSMKDVPVQLPQGIVPAAVLERASYKDILVPRTDDDRFENINNDDPGSLSRAFVVATSSLRRKAQWLHRYPNSLLENLRGNVNTRLAKLSASEWDGAIFAAAGLERIGLRPPNAIDLEWMLPAPAQGAILVVARLDDQPVLGACASFNHEETAICVKAERDFLRTLMGGCSTPISALAEIKNGRMRLQGNLLSFDGRKCIAAERDAPVEKSYSIGVDAALEVIDNGGAHILKDIRKGE